MKIIIDLSENYIVEAVNKEEDKRTVLENAVANGISISEKHGRIIDESKIKNVYGTLTEKGWKITHTDAPTIIEEEINCAK